MLKNLAYTAAGLVAGVALTITTVISPAASVQADEHAALAAAQKAQVMTSIYQLDKAGLHDIDVKANAGEAAPSGALGNVRRARIAVQATDWPEPFHGTVKDLTQHLTELEAALTAENIQAAAAPGKGAHDVGHKLSNDVYAWLSGAEPSEHGH